MQLFLREWGVPPVVALVTAPDFCLNSARAYYLDVFGLHVSLFPFYPSSPSFTFTTLQEWFPKIPLYIIQFPITSTSIQFDFGFYEISVFVLSHSKIFS